MPPRKRAASAPKTDSDTELPTEGEVEQQDSGADSSTETEPPVSTEGKTERSDLQAVDAPCPECFPGGWPEQSFAVGCEHGSWTRD